MTPQSIKQKGRIAENLVVEYLQRWWPMAERRRLNGIHDRGDVAGIHSTVVEVKSGAKIELGTWMRELDVEVANDHAEHGVLVIKPKGTTDAAQFYAVVRFEEWVDLRRACNG
jgi:hypothetical protein